MPASQYDVVIIGAGCAGLSAAIGLARAGFGVVVLEAAAYPGAENWSGCVYFCENLVHPSLLGPEGVEGLAWERRLVERGAFAGNGNSLLGMTYRDPDAFRHCYTVLRPIFDHHLAQLAMQAGVVLLNSTTVESLLRDGSRVIGVATSRGPVYADLTFLAEGDAGQLVTREGYERPGDSTHQPRFLHGIKQIIDLPPGAVEKNFGLGAGEGAAYEIILRNGTLRGQPLHLNMGGFVYTNRQSLSVGLVLPAEHLHRHFGGDPNLLMEWFENLPDLQKWFSGGTRGVFGAKLIRGGGARDIPRMVDDGLAIGGAATALGVDFPYPNYTGPATRMGLQIVEAAKTIRRARGAFTHAELERHYLEPLRQTRYWKDVEYLRHWPGYVEKTQLFFGRNVDLALGTAYLWTRPKHWLPRKLTNWVKMLLQLAGAGRWRELIEERRYLNRALRINEVAGRPAVGTLLLHGWLNSIRDLFGQPRRAVPPAGAVRLVYSAGGDGEGVALPRMMRRWFQRFGPVLAAAAKHVYQNDETPLPQKLRAATQLLLQQVNLLDAIWAGVGAAAAGSIAAALLGFEWLRSRVRAATRMARRLYPPRGAYAQFEYAARRAGDLTPLLTQAARNWEDRLGQLAYLTARQSHIHIHWPEHIETRHDVVKAGLWHVCPAHVYEARVNPLGQLQIVVNFENCIKCETCWRTSDLVDWGRDGRHRFLYPVHSPAVSRLLAAQDAAATVAPSAPDKVDDFSQPTKRLRSADRADGPKLRLLLAGLDRKLNELADALDEEPRTIDRARGEYLGLLARYAQQLADTFANLVRQSETPEAQTLLHLMANSVTNKVNELVRQIAHHKYAWAAATGRHVQQHHLAALARILSSAAESTADEPHRRWLCAEHAEKTADPQIAAIVVRLDEVCGPYLWRDLEKDGALTPPQDAAIRDLLNQIPAIDPKNPGAALRAPVRKAFLAELGRRDPSLAFRAASHLWARDLSRMYGAPPAADGWMAFGLVENGEALFVPRANHVLLLVGDSLEAATSTASGLQVDAEETLGLRGARLERIRVANSFQAASRTPVQGEAVRRAYHVLSAADLTSIAFGIADQLLRRAAAHAASRVQFPGLFHDEQARDTIGKFGAIKQMLAEMGARRYVLETLDQNLSPADFSEATAQRAALVKAVVADALGTAPGSLSYNAGQIFGGTGYSEDDVLSKFYRDAAAWRFLGQPNPDIWERHGQWLTDPAHVDSPQLMRLADEDELFDRVAQRHALQAEMDHLRVLRTRLRALIGHLPQAHRRYALEILARQDALLLAGKALLFRTHARLEEGLSSEALLPLLRVWLDYVDASLEAADTEAEPTPPPVSSSVPTAEIITTYAQFLQAPASYDSGDFLCTPVNSAQPRYMPEMVQADPHLAEADRFYRGLLLDYFGKQRTNDGRPYERLIESWHRPSEADLEFTRKHGFFRMTIPKELGGEGKKKCEYYMLTSHGQVLADVSWSLAIQANTSIGTTPVLLARDKDLPKARQDLAPFVGDASLQTDIRERLAGLVQMVDRVNPQALQKAFLELQQQLDKAVFKRAVLKTLAHRFAESWSQAGRAGKSFDVPALRANLEAAATAWQEVCDRAPNYHEELALRQQACDLALRWIASGQISAFALTEPSAGSDTARVATRARLRSVVAEKQADGIYSFVPHGGAAARWLLDASRLEFRPDGAYYRFSPHTAPGRIGFDEYDYETDDPAKLRYFLRDGERKYFHDIAFLRPRGGAVYYDYWELTGAKMWITNGRICGIMSLYAKTEEGVTGFIVDRHAEALIIGKDEAKMGQNGSPTNEVSLQAVRVPRENVLGLEGRGQVNALETLNVGRAGLGMSAVAQIKSIIAMSRDFLASGGPKPSARQDWRIDRMEEERFAAESVAYEVIGRFEHKQTRSVRMESAIAKMLASELLHSVIELAEDVHGLEGQTRRRLIEKRKRDARILNIYEGTNEVQRFLILKELVSEVLPRWAAVDAKPDSPVAAAVQTLLDEFRQRLAAAVEVFGGGLWQNPNLQPDGFLLAEAATWLKAVESVAGRLVWLERQGQETAVARRSLVRCVGEVRRRLKRFDAALERLKHGYYAESVRAAQLMLDDTVHAAPQAALELRSQIEQPLSILVVVEPAAGNVPKPLVRDGQLLEPYHALTDADRAALETALQLRDQARSAAASDSRNGAAPVKITVAAVGPPRLVPLLREVQALRVARTLLVATQEPGPLAMDQAADALAEVARRRGERFDLILGPNCSADLEEGMLAPLTAQVLDVPYAGSCASLAVRHTAAEHTVLLRDAPGKSPRPRALPAAVGVVAGLPLRPFSTGGYFEGLATPVEIVPWPATVKAEPFKWIAATQAATAADKPPRPLGSIEAAELLREQLGLHGERIAAADELQVRIDDEDAPTVLDGGKLIAVIAADREGRLTHGASALAAALPPMAAVTGHQCAVLLLALPNEAAQRHALHQLGKLGVTRIAILSHEHAAAPPAVRARLLVEAWPALRQSPRIVLGEAWMETAFMALRHRSGRSQTLICRVKKVDAASCVPGVETARSGGRLRTERYLLSLEAETTYWLTATEDVEVLGGKEPVATSEDSGMVVVRWSPPLEALFGSGDMQRLLAELKEETGIVRLADVDFILDVGYGVGNRDGYEEVILPLEEALKAMGVRNLMIGGSRKVTEELHLLPLDRQIGQSGVSVNPRILLAIGISGAPQHLNYIGPRATVIAFNRDPEAPLLTLNQRQPRPRVFPVVGDLFHTVPAFIAALRAESGVE